MEQQFSLFERPEKKGINQTSQHISPYNECERLESTYKEYLHHCKRVKSQARLPNEILDTFQLQIESGMNRQIVLGLLYCILTNNNPSCNYPWNYLKDLKIANKEIIRHTLSLLVDDYILYITSDSLNQIFWFLDGVLSENWYSNENLTNKFVCDLIICICRHIDVNRVTRYSLNLSQSVEKFIFTHLEWMVKLNKNNQNCIFIHQIIYLFLRLIENHDHIDLQESRTDEIRFVCRLFDCDSFSWNGTGLNIGKDFIRLFQHLYPLQSFTKYWALIDSDNALVDILSSDTNPLIFQVCISKQEEKDLIALANDIEKEKDTLQIAKCIEIFVDKYLRRNKLAEHACDVIRFVISGYNNNWHCFAGKDVFLFNLLFYFFARSWKNEVRSFIYEAMLMEILYSAQNKSYKSYEIIARVLEQGSTRQPDITANFIILILETVRHYKSSLPKHNKMRLLPYHSVIHFFKSTKQKCQQIIKRKDFADKYLNLVQQFNKEFANQLGNNSNGKAVRNKLQIEDNFASAIHIESSTQSNNNKILFQVPDFKKDIENVAQCMDRMQCDEYWSVFSNKLKDLKPILMDYYCIKLIEMQDIKTEKQKRSVSLRLNELLKNIEKYINQLLKSYAEYVNDSNQQQNMEKKKLFMERFSSAFVDIFALDYQHCFVAPDRMSPLWNIILDWCSKSKPKNCHNEFEFDFIENRLWFLKAMCNYQEELKYIVLLYDSKQSEAKGFIKHLGVVQRKKNKSNGLAAIHGWNNNQIEGVRITAHAHALLYGRRPFESIICDLCDSDWNGSSWHCKNGCDFDTCHNCFVKYLKQKQLYRCILYLRAKYDNIKLVKKKHNNITLYSELFYDDIKKLQLKSSLLLSAIHQYLFYSYSTYIYPRIMDLVQIILQVINPLQVQSLSKDIQLALFQLFNTDNVTHKLPKYIEVSLRFPQYVQLSFWSLLNSFLRTRNNCDELYIHALKHLSQLKKAYIYGNNTSQCMVWITATAMNGLLDWTQIVYRSKKIDEIYDALLSFPLLADGEGETDTDVAMNNKSMSPSTTVFNMSTSAFDEFHIQCLVQLLSLKSPRWKSWLQSKLKYFKNKYEQKQAEYENGDEFVSLNKARKRRSNDANDTFQCNVSFDEFDRGYLLNLLKFYEYLTFVEPGVKDNAVSVMANSFLYDADQRNILVRFFSQFSSLTQYLHELRDFWPPESSKSASPNKNRSIQVMSAQQILATNMTAHKKPKKHKKRKKFMANDTNSESDEDYNEKEDVNDAESSEENEAADKVGKGAKTVVKRAKRESMDWMNNQSDSTSSSNSHSSIGKRRKKEQNLKKNARKYRENNEKSNKELSPLILIPKRRQINTSKRSRTQSNVDNNNNNKIYTPPNKKRKINISPNNNNSPIKRHQSNNKKSNNSLKRSNRKRKKKNQIQDSSDEDEHNTAHPLFSKQKYRQKKLLSKSPKSPTRSESSVSYEYDEEEEEEEDSLANRYSAHSSPRKPTTNNTNNEDDTNEAWFP